MTVVSCSGKFHAFALTEQLEKHEKLNKLFTTFFSKKNYYFRKFVRRIDKEDISVNFVSTNLFIAILIKIFPKTVFYWNNMFDYCVRFMLNKRSGNIFIGWSGMSLHSITKAKELGMITILERGSSHILFQNDILRKEYRKFGIKFTIHKSVIAKELKEYEVVDYISVPSNFVKNSFIEFGIKESKLILNPYGVSKNFQFEIKPGKENPKFTIVYLGTLSIRKGLIYLYEALNLLEISQDEYEVLFIGSIDKEFIGWESMYKKPNWRFLGHINHYELKNYLNECHVAVHPSLEEGMSMVIPQLMACQVPVIATTNTGGADIINDNIDGFIIPIRSPKAIAEKISFLFKNPEKLKKMKLNAFSRIQNGFTWDDYGKRYVRNLEEILQNK